MDRRKLSAEVAVARETKEREKEERKKDSMEQRVNDRRNLHLARVGLIRGDAVMNMSKHDLKLRDRWGNATRSFYCFLIDSRIN